MTDEPISLVQKQKEPNPALIQLLECALRDAKAGELSCVFMVGVMEDGESIRRGGAGEWGVLRLPALLEQEALEMRLKVLQTRQIVPDKEDPT